jgi:hypothetical protein
MIAPAMLMSMVLSAPPSLTPFPDDPTTRGITGAISVTVESGILRARPDLSIDDPLLVRIAAVHDLPDGSRVFDLEYMCTQAGTHDLRSVLVFADGRPIDTLEPLQVEIISQLGLNAPSDLDMTSPPPSTLMGGYIKALIVLGALWIAIPAVVIIRRLLRPKPIPVVETPPPTLADLLRPLVLGASQGELDVDGQARLELLLHRYWTQHLHLNVPPHEAVAILHEHETAGVLLHAIESWLHNPRGQDLSPDEIADLLAPYADIPADAAP